MLVFDGLNEVVRVRQVGVRVRTAKVGFRDAVLDGGFREAENVAEDGFSVRASNTVQGVKEDGRGLAVVGCRLEVGLDRVKVKDFLQEGKVVFNRVDDFNFQGSVGECALLGKVQVWQVHRLVRLELLGDFVNLVGHVFRCRSTVVAVELDTKVIIGSTGVVGRGEEDTTVRLSGSDQGGCGRGGEDGVFTDQDFLDTVGSRDPQDDLGCFRRLWGER